MQGFPNQNFFYAQQICIFGKFLKNVAIVMTSIFLDNFQKQRDIHQISIDYCYKNLSQAYKCATYY